MTKEQKKQLYGFGLPIILGTILLLGVSYAWFQLTLNGTKTNVLQVESLSLELDDEKSVGIDGDGIVPMLDEVGLEQDPYRFTLINKGNIDSDYTIYLDDVDLLVGETKLPDTVIKYNLTRDENQLFIRKLSESVVNGKRVLDTGRIGAGESYVYDLRMWIDYDATKDQAAGKTFRGKIHAEAQQVIEQPPTPEECFAFDGKGTITKYLCGPEIEKNGSIGTNDNSPIGRIISDVVIPKKIRGVDVVNIGYSSEECESNERCQMGYYPFSFQGEGYGITSVVIPDGIKVIGSGAFSSNQLTNIIIPEGVTEIGGSAFSYNQLTTVTIPENVTTIGGSAFAYNKLTSITLPSTLTTIGWYVFIDNQLTTVTIPENVTTIEGSAFSSNRLTNIIIPERVTKIGSAAFSGNKLTTIIIPKSVTTIDEYAFSGNQLTTVTLPSSVTKVGAEAFGNNNLTNVIIKGKSSPATFDSYGTNTSYNADASPFGSKYGSSGWLEGSNCETHYEANKDNASQYWGDETNPCIHWEP